MAPRRLSTPESRAQSAAMLARVRKLEDEEDRVAVAQTRKEKGAIAWSLVKRDLGLA